MRVLYSGRTGIESVSFCGGRKTGQPGEKPLEQRTRTNNNQLPFSSFKVHSILRFAGLMETQTRTATVYKEQMMWPFILRWVENFFNTCLRFILFPRRITVIGRGVFLTDFLQRVYTIAPRAEQLDKICQV